MFLVELYLAIAMLNSPLYKDRESAQMYLQTHDVCFDCLYPLYARVKDMKYPEVTIRLREVLKWKYIEDYGEVFMQTEYLYDEEGKYVGSVEVLNQKLLDQKFKAILLHGL